MARRFDALALDVDGTLIGASGDVSPRLRAALARARAAGLHIVLCTGRPWLATQPLLRDLAIATPPVVFNGALVPALAGGEPLVCQPLPSAVLPTLLAAALAHNDYLELHTLDRCTITREGPESAYQRLKLGITLETAPAGAMPPDGPILKAQFVVGAGSAAERIAALGPALAPEVELSWGVSPGFDGHFVNVMRAGVTKCASLTALWRALGVRWERVFAAGDSPSDLGYVRRAGYGVIMAEAPNAVRAAAPRVAPPLAEGGLAALIEDVVLAGC
ncbi:MAG: HAD hydrolase family protein [Chloroflexota bacterium]